MKCCFFHEYFLFCLIIWASHKNVAHLSGGILDRENNPKWFNLWSKWLNFSLGDRLKSYIYIQVYFRISSQILWVNFQSDWQEWIRQMTVVLGEPQMRERLRNRRMTLQINAWNRKGKLCLHWSNQWESNSQHLEYNTNVTITVLTFGHSGWVSGKSLTD